MNLCRLTAVAASAADNVYTRPIPPGASSSIIGTGSVTLATDEAASAFMLGVGGAATSTAAAIADTAPALQTLLTGIRSLDVLWLERLAGRTRRWR